MTWKPLLTPDVAVAAAILLAQLPVSDGTPMGEWGKFLVELAAAAWVGVKVWVEFQKASDGKGGGNQQVNVAPPTPVIVDRRDEGRDFGTMLEQIRGIKTTVEAVADSAVAERTAITTGFEHLAAQMGRLDVAVASSELAQRAADDNLVVSKAIQQSLSRLEGQLQPLHKEPKRGRRTQK